MRLRLCAAASVIALVAAGVSSPVAVQRSSREGRVDTTFSRWSSTTPGCAVGVSEADTTVLQRAYGMADLEHDVPNRPDTIFEAGSVSKQFTAAAVLMLAHDGKLSLDDPVRKYLPEVPDYGTPITIRQMVNHTSGLRDWGAVADIAGWRRTTRVHTHAHVLDIVSRQRALNFEPGTRWSYSNTGYNLAAILVARVSGQSFADFTKSRIFDPLDMTRTSWRDDYRRIVKGRAIAYASSGGGFISDMPFENVHGNGGLLTTVDDLLRWTRNFRTLRVGSAAFVKEAQTPGQFNDGRPHDYALGLRLAEHRGVREIGHSGATAGYRAYLADYPQQRVSVAVLCNTGSANAEESAHAVADIYLDLKVPPDTAANAQSVNGNPRTSPDVPPAGVYRRTDTGEPIVVSRDDGALRIDSTAPLIARSATRYVRSNGTTFDFSADGVAVTDRFGTVLTYARVPAADVSPRPLRDYLGAYRSDEAEAVLTAAVDGNTLVLQRRPDSVIRLTPVYADGFRSAMGFIRFHRNAEGNVTALSVTQDRVWDLRFTKEGAVP